MACFNHTVRHNIIRSHSLFNFFVFVTNENTGYPVVAAAAAAATVLAGVCVYTDFYVYCMILLSHRI